MGDNDQCKFTVDLSLHCGWFVFVIHAVFIKKNYPNIHVCLQNVVLNLNLNFNK